MQKNRKANVLMAEKYYNEYLKLIDHYKQLDKETKNLWKNFETNKKFILSRDQKISQYKSNKELEMKIKV
jgi:hypothetical protein